MTIKARASDGVIGMSGDAAITCLTSMIERAVRSNDDANVAELDQVLRHVEKIIDTSGGGPADRSPVVIS